MGFETAPPLREFRIFDALFNHLTTKTLPLFIMGAGGFCPLYIYIMTSRNRKEVYDALRAEYPVFSFRDFAIRQEEGKTAMGFIFETGERHRFTPRWLIHYGRWLPKNIEPGLPDEVWAFHLGMIEMISYWKAFCSPQIDIQCGALTVHQAQWWFKLYQHGLGEFFYTNGMDIPGEDMLHFVSQQKDPGSGCNNPLRLQDEVRGAIPHLGAMLVPVGGGKDSVVSLELLKKAGHKIIPFVINPRGATEGVVSQAGFAPGDTISMDRQIDPLLLELNEKGFLNGHTPFSAMLAFASAYVASRLRIPHIALSNESSANEPSVPGTKINHQYSKSLEFEHDFRQYMHTYLDQSIDYFSLLRPLNELQIAALFSGFKQYHQVFRSCNAGSKENSWCGKCAKCLFTYVILSPFLSVGQLQAIFGSNLLADNSLQSMLFDLCGDGTNKPFECVGTTDEVNTALVYVIRQLESRGTSLPELLEAYRRSHLWEQYKEEDIRNHLRQFDEAHCLDNRFESLVLNALEGIEGMLV